MFSSDDAKLIKFNDSRNNTTMRTSASTHISARVVHPSMRPVSDYGMHSAMMPPTMHSAMMPPTMHSAMMPPMHSAMMPTTMHSAMMPPTMHSAMMPTMPYQMAYAMAYSLTQNMAQTMAHNMAQTLTRNMTTPYISHSMEPTQSFQPGITELNVKAKAFVPSGVSNKTALPSASGSKRLLFVKPREPKPEVVTLPEPIQNVAESAPEPEPIQNVAGSAPEPVAHKLPVAHAAHIRTHIFVDYVKTKHQRHTSPVDRRRIASILYRSYGATIDTRIIFGTVDKTTNITPRFTEPEEQFHRRVIESEEHYRRSIFESDLHYKLWDDAGYNVCVLTGNMKPLMENYFQFWLKQLLSTHTKVGYKQRIVIVEVDDQPSCSESLIELLRSAIVEHEYLIDIWSLQSTVQPAYIRFGSVYSDYVNIRYIKDYID